jgi:hypothetical protein
MNKQREKLKHATKKNPRKKDQLAVIAASSETRS